MPSVKLKFTLLSTALLVFLTADLFATTEPEPTTKKIEQFAAHAGQATFNYSKSIFFPAEAQSAIAKALGWVNDASACSICGGYYREFPIPYQANPLASDQSENYNIYAQHSEWSMKGTSTFKGDVKLIQPTRELTADLVKVRRNPNTSKVQYIDAFGNVHLIEPGILVLADQGTLNVNNKNMMLHNMIYRFGKENRTKVINPTTGKVEYHLNALNARGHAQIAKQIKPHVFVLHHASYTACPPTSNTWKLTGSTVHLNYNTGWGSAYNAMLYIKNIPVFYFPYYSFPIDKRRKTGFLTPSFAYDYTNGATLTLPFYWNMAPNFDDTLTPDFMSKRGVLFNNNFRYMTAQSNTTFDASIIPHDQLFSDYKEKARRQYAGKTDSAEQLHELENDSDTRSAISLNSQAQINSHWSDAINYNYMSDDYFQRDFKMKTNGADNQLLQNAQLNFASNYWSAGLLAQRYQTLHPLDTTAIQNQYRRWPQLSLGIGTPEILGGLTAQVNAAFTKFDIARNPEQGKRLVNGRRAYANPEISWAIEKPYGFLTPSATLTPYTVPP